MVFAFPLQSKSFESAMMFSKIWQNRAETTSNYPGSNVEAENVTNVEVEPSEISLLRKLIQAELSNIADLQGSNTEPSFKNDVEDLIGIQHYAYLIESIKNSKEKIVIMSGWLSKHVIDDTFIELISNKLKQGISIYIGYGFQDSNGNHKKFKGSQEVLNSLIKLIKKHPNQLFVANYATHEKLLVLDERVAVIGSANWLSNRQYKNSECSAIITNRKYVVSAADRAILAVKQNRIVVEIPKLKPRAKASANVDALSEADKNLLVKLKAVRTKLAREKSVPAYIIFYDSVLIKMARERPTTRDQMLAISGVGEVKFERFGSDFMEVVSEA